MNDKEEKITVIAADDHQLFLDGLEMLLEGNTEISLEGSALNGEDLLALVKKILPRVVLLDISLQKENGLDLVVKIKEASAASRVIVLTMHSTRDYITDALETGVHGYLLKNTGKEELLGAIRKVAGGENHYSQKVTETMMKTFSPDVHEKEGRTKLTRREEEILRLICKQFTNNEIADKLCISQYTVETHRKNLLSKLNVKNTAGLVKFAIESGLA